MPQTTVENHIEPNDLIICGHSYNSGFGILSQDDHARATNINGWI